MRVAAAVSLLAAAANAHVSMTYLDGQVGSIRNANGETGNGRASVARNCGGAQTFGSNGIGQAQDGQSVTLAMRYAAGHNGQFRMAFACTENGQDLEDGDATLTAADNDCEVSGGQADGTYTDSVGAVGQQTMEITCTLPEQSNDVATNCIIGILDQRNWGGCVDVSLLPAAAALPPSPPPAPLISSAGSYGFSMAGMVNTAKGDVPGLGTFTCCALVEGFFEVADYQLGSQSITAQFRNAKAINCPDQAPDPDAAPPPNTAEFTIGDTVTMESSLGGAKYTGQVTLAGQPFEVSISDGSLEFSNVGGEQPIICDGFSTAGAPDGSGNTGDSALGTDDTLGTPAIAAIVVVLLIVLAGGAFFYMRSKNTSAPPPPAGVTMSKAPDGGAALPPGWSAQVDPNSGATYYYNAQTGATSWHNPSNAV